MRKKFSAYAKTYSTVLMLATLSSFLLDPRLGYIFGLDFVLTAVLSVLGLPASAECDFVSQPENCFVIICGGAAILVLLLSVVARILWSKHKKFSAITFSVITALDCAFIVGRLLLNMGGPKGVLYCGGSFLWKSVGLLCLTAFLASTTQDSKSGQS